MLAPSGTATWEMHDHLVIIFRVASSENVQPQCAKIRLLFFENDCEARQILEKGMWTYRFQVKSVTNFLAHLKPIDTRDSFAAVHVLRACQNRRHNFCFFCGHSRALYSVRSLLFLQVFVAGD